MFWVIWGFSSVLLDTIVTCMGIKKGFKDKEINVKK